MPKLTGADLTVFTVGGTNMLCHATEVTYDSNIGDEDGSCINEISEDPVAVSRTRRITGNGNVLDKAVFLQILESATPNVAFTLTSAGFTVTGNALVVAAPHTIRRKGLQTMNFELKVKGTPTLTFPT